MLGASAKQRLSRSNADVVAERSVPIANPSTPVSPSAPLSRPSESNNGDKTLGTSISNQALPGIKALQSDGDLNFDHLPPFDLPTSPETLQRNWNAMVNDAVTVPETPTVPYLQSIDNAILPPILQDWSNNETSNHILPIPRVSPGIMPNSPTSSASWRLVEDTIAASSQQQHSQLPQLSLLLSDIGDHDTRDRDNTTLPPLSQDIINPGYSNRSSIEGDKDVSTRNQELNPIYSPLTSDPRPHDRQNYYPVFKEP